MPSALPTYSPPSTTTGDENEITMFCGSNVITPVRALRRYQRLFLTQLPADQQGELLSLLHGFDAIVLLPGSRASTMTP